MLFIIFSWILMPIIVIILPFHSRINALCLMLIFNVITIYVHCINYTNITTSNKAYTIINFLVSLLSINAVDKIVVSNSMFEIELTTTNTITEIIKLYFIQYLIYSFFYCYDKIKNYYPDNVLQIQDPVITALNLEISTTLSINLEGVELESVPIDVTEDEIASNENNIDNLF